MVSSGDENWWFPWGFTKKNGELMRFNGDSMVISPTKMDVIGF